MALRAAPARPVRGLAGRIGGLLGGHAEPAGCGQAHDRPRLLRRNADQPGLRAAVCSGGGAGAGHGGALLFRGAAGRKSGRRSARPPVCPSDWPGCRLPRSQPQWRAGVAPIGRQRTAARRGRHHHVGGLAQFGHGDRQPGDAVRHQPAAGRLHLDRHSAGGAADRARRATPAEDLAGQPGPRGRCQHACRRNTRGGAHGAGTCARGLREQPLQPGLAGSHRDRARTHPHPGHRHRSGDHADLRGHRRGAVVGRARCHRRADDAGHAGPVRAVCTDWRWFGGCAGRSVERAATRCRWHGADRRVARRAVGNCRARDPAAVAGAGAWRDPFRPGGLPLPAAPGHAGAGWLRPACAAGRNRGAGRPLRRRQEHGAGDAVALPRPAERQRADR